ncbi:MAG: hypothetical protein AAGA48_28620 [Myxococcota bacterium]
MTMQPRRTRQHPPLVRAMYAANTVYKAALHLRSPDGWVTLWDVRRCVAGWEANAEYQRRDGSWRTVEDRHVLPGLQLAATWGLIVLEERPAVAGKHGRPTTFCRLASRPLGMATSDQPDADDGSNVANAVELEPVGESLEKTDGGTPVRDRGQALLTWLSERHEAGDRHVTMEQMTTGLGWGRTSVRRAVGDLLKRGKLGKAKQGKKHIYWATRALLGGGS